MLLLFKRNVHNWSGGNGTQRHAQSIYVFGESLSFGKHVCLREHFSNVQKGT